MAILSEKVSGGKLVSCKFRAFLDKDESGKQIFRYMTWHPPEGLTLAKAKKAAELADHAWEQETKINYQREQETVKIPANEMAGYAFDWFVNDVWTPLYLRDGSHRPSTVTYYSTMLKIIQPYFEGIPLDEVTGLKINEYLAWLRTDYRTAKGKPLSEKTIKQHYDTLRLIYNYAERKEILPNNPIKKVDVPKVTKKPVDALSADEAEVFLKALSACELDFKCMMQLLLTAGLRRGECLGLQFRDIDC